MTSLQLSLLGTFELRWGDQPVAKFPTDKVRALLAYLALEGDRPLRRETLAALLWADWSEEIAKRNLRQNLHRLNQLLDKLEPGLSKRLLVVTRQSVQVDYDFLTADARQLQQLLTAVANHPHRHLRACPACLDKLTCAADLAQGDLLAGFSLPDAPLFDEWLTVQREHFHAQTLQLLHSLAEVGLERQDYERASLYAARQIALEPWREEAHRQTMLALARQGRRSEALAQYAACVRILEEEMGLEPAEETVALYEQIAADRLPPPPETAVTLHNFPATFTPFVGRQAECAQIADQLQERDGRLTTIVAPPGMGKTRLALQVVQQTLAVKRRALGDLFPDGVHFISLCGGTTADAAAAVATAALPAAASAESLTAYLGDKKCLLLLDDAGPAVAPLLAEWLAGARGLRLLVTAVAPLALPGEWTFPLAGLPADDGLDSPAAQLFIQTARRVQHDFAPDTADEAAIARICQLTAGSPLALETAAAWTRLLTCAQIAEQLERDATWLASAL